jgi:radical SAM protein with 4Fe4S-binding SPASM domain
VERDKSTLPISQKLYPLCRFTFSYFFFRRTYSRRFGGDEIPYLRVTKTPLVRRTPLGTYLCFPHGFALESFYPTIEIDESTEELFNLCDGTRTKEEIIRQLAEESGEPREEIAEAFDEFAEYAVSEGLMEWSEKHSFVEPIYRRNRPFSISIELTSACNLQCPFCSVNSGAPGPDDLTLDDLVIFVEQVKKLKPTPVALSGGEPLLKKEMVLYAVKELSPLREITVTVFTNGTLVTKDYAQQLHDAGLKVARVSVDGHNAEVHDGIRGKGAFEKTVHGIEYLKELGIHVDVISVISRINYRYIKEIEDFVSTIGDSYALSYVYPYGRAAHSDMLLTPKEIFDVKISGLVSKDFETSITPRNRCHVGETICVAANGDIYPCLRLRLPEFKVGNIRENDLCDIYTTDLMQDILKFTVEDAEKCKDCEIRYFCGGGCRGFAYAIGGSLYGPDTINCGSNNILSRKILEEGEKNTRTLLQELVESTKKLG